jgi:hypothetical protein
MKRNYFLLLAVIFWFLYSCSGEDAPPSEDFKKNGMPAKQN